jgi:hypothetical protein
MPYKKSLEADLVFLLHGHVLFIPELQLSWKLIVLQVIFWSSKSGNLSYVRNFLEEHEKNRCSYENTCHFMMIDIWLRSLANSGQCLTNKTKKSFVSTVSKLQKTWWQVVVGRQICDSSSSLMEKLCFHFLPFSCNSLAQTLWKVNKVTTSCNS